MAGQNAPIWYSPLTETQLLFNNPKFSDVRFLVDGETVYGHKIMLAMGSPVFESMFYGELKEKREVFEIEDLESVSFKNALRYIYGFKINCELSELHETYMAADKYLLNHYSRALFSFIIDKLTNENSCLIYEQLVKIGDREESALAYVRDRIIESTKEVFESDHFTQISQEMLISLLSLEKLSIDEIDLFKAVSKWVDCEVRRRGLSVNRENRRLVFESIKGYILFSELTPEKIANCKEVVELLTKEELLSLLSLLLRLVNKEEPLAIELKTSRVAGTSPKMNLDDSDDDMGFGLFD